MTQRPKPWYVELIRTKRAYLRASLAQRRFMERRALLYSSLCVHTSWRASFRYWAEHRMNPLPAGQLFYANRRLMRPADWGDSPKARFGRALCGAWQDNDSCADVLMETYFPKAKVTTVGQWALWLHRAYPMRHPNEGSLLGSRVIEEHITILRWVREGGRRDAYSRIGSPAQRIQGRMGGRS